MTIDLESIGAMYAASRAQWARENPPEEPRTHCHCGQPATHEVQVGWVNCPYGGAGHGQYDQVCVQCADEAAQ